MRLSSRVRPREPQSDDDADYSELGSARDPGTTPMHRYKNLSRWRVMPSEKAVADGYYDRGFGNKVKAVAYQK